MLVNPTTNCSDAAVPLPGTWYDPEANGSAPLRAAAVAPQQGRILLSAPLAQRAREGAAPVMVEARRRT